MSDTEEPVTQTHMEQLTSRYKAPWKEFDLNTEFWTEVLKDRLIVDVLFDQHGVAGIKLDDGQTVHFTGISGRICIQDGNS